MPGAHVGVLVQDMDTGQLYRYHPLDHFTPASNNKLFVASAALIGLVPNGNTPIRIPRKRIKRGTVKGDMVGILWVTPRLLSLTSKK